MNLGSFPAGSELLFGIIAHNTFDNADDTFVMGPSCRNFDNGVHGRVTPVYAEGSETIVGWMVEFEDLRAGAITPDFGDARILVRGVNASSATTAVPDQCNGLDDDCDNSVDENFIPQACEAEGKQGVCRDGMTACNAGVFARQPGASSAEICDGLDNDCDGLVDDSPTDAGQSCDTGQPGVCSAGAQNCTGGSLTCKPNVAPSPEI